MTICIDPGHGGRDPGGQTDNPFAYQEKEFNLNFSLMLEERLEQFGHWVVVVRRRDRYVSLNSKAKSAGTVNYYKIKAFPQTLPPWSSTAPLQVCVVQLQEAYWGAPLHRDIPSNRDNQTHEDHKT